MTYTFAVCVKCTVQSPPILSDDAYVALQVMGWKKLQSYSQVSVVGIVGICPQCQELKAA